MPSTRDDQNFAAELTPHIEASAKLENSALDAAINWISGNLSPDDVFDTKELSAWAESNGYTKE